MLIIQHLDAYNTNNFITKQITMVSILPCVRCKL